MINTTIIVALVAAFIGIFLDARRRSRRLTRRIAEEKADIVSESGATANIGVFHSASDMAVILAASEERGAFYYKVLRKGKAINRSRINLANVVKTDLIVDFSVKNLGAYSRQKPSAQVATDVASRVAAQYSPAELRALRRIGLRITFLDEGGQTKVLDTTVMRADNDQHRFRRVELLKDAVWWTVFLNSACAKAKEVLQHLHEKDK